MPGRKNDIMFVKFDSDSSRRRFLNRILSKELEVTFQGTMLKPLKCRTETQKEKTKHIDKFKRVVCEAIRAKYPETTEETLKDKIVTGMNDGGVGWIGEKRVAETTNGKFILNPVKIKEEAKTHGWDIEGEEIEAEYRRQMQQ